MIDSFKTSFRLKNTYRVNRIIYAIREFPFIKKLISDKIYENKVIKIIAQVISVFIELGDIFIMKLLYLLLMLYLPANGYQTDTTNTFLQILLFLTIAGMFLNTYMFDPSRDKYYAMFLMRMDANKYTLSNYYYALLKNWIGLFTGSLIIGSFMQLPLYICLLIPCFVVSLKMINAVYALKRYEKTGKIEHENTPTIKIYVVIGICLLLAYGLPFINIIANQTIFVGIASVITIIGILSMKYIHRFNKYKDMYRKILAGAILDTTAYSKQIMEEANRNYIVNDSTIQSDKKGYAFLHDIFVKRHKKLLLNSTKKLTVAIVMIIIATIIAVLTVDELKVRINNMMLNSLPYFVFIMYAINRTAAMLQTMFMNCDHSMLTYSFFKQPKAILELFVIRLKSVITINLLPAITIGLGLPIILWVTGGTQNPYEYLILFVSIVASSVFFSVHYLIMYYLLQPYNINIESKNGLYTCINVFTYMICYALIQLKLRTFEFGIAIFLFSVIYIIIACIAAYRLAPKTFKLRI